MVGWWGGGGGAGQGQNKCFVFFPVGSLGDVFTLSVCVCVIGFCCCCFFALFLKRSNQEHVSGGRGGGRRLCVCVRACVRE